jgi:hypothetical protein
VEFGLPTSDDAVKMYKSFVTKKKDTLDNAQLQAFEATFTQHEKLLSFADMHALFIDVWMDQKLPDGAARQKAIIQRLKTCIGEKFNEHEAIKQRNAKNEDTGPEPGNWH